jgi:predicted nucleic acid-binding protein
VIVADTNLLVYLLVPTPLTRAAEQVRALEKVWIAPPLIRHELLNVLARYVRRGDVTLDEAGRACRRAEDLIEVSTARPDATDILRAAGKTNCSTYDLEYVWLARELDLPLVTADQEVLAAFPDVARHFR